MPDTKTPGTALAVSHSSRDLASLDQLDEILLTGELNVEVIDDPGSISQSIISQLLGAGTDEELQNFGNAEPWAEHLDTPMELHSFTWRPSEFEEGAAIYFIVQATDLATGDNRVLTTGSMNVLAQLSNMARRGTLEGAVWQLHRAEKPTKAGFRPMWLVQPESVRAAARERAAQERQAADTPAAA